MTNTKFEEKPWGYEKILFCSDTHYLFKELFMKKGCRCSLQHHVDKRETVYIIEGKLKVLLDDEIYLLHPHNHLSISPGQIHRMEAITDTLYLEASTPHPNDVVRHEDDYGRTHRL